MSDYLFKPGDLVFLIIENHVTRVRVIDNRSGLVTKCLKSTNGRVNWYKVQWQGAKGGFMTEVEGHLINAKRALELRDNPYAKIRRRHIVWETRDV